MMEYCAIDPHNRADPLRVLLLADLPGSRRHCLPAWLTFRSQGPCACGIPGVERARDDDFTLDVGRVVVGARELLSDERQLAESGVVIAHIGADRDCRRECAVAAARESHIETA